MLGDQKDRSGRPMIAFGVTITALGFPKVAKEATRDAVDLAALTYGSVPTSMAVRA